MRFCLWGGPFRLAGCSIPVLLGGHTPLRMETERGDSGRSRHLKKRKKKVLAGQEIQSVLTPSLIINSYSNRSRKFSRARHSVKGTCTNVRIQVGNSNNNMTSKESMDTYAEHVWGESKILALESVLLGPAESTMQNLQSAVEGRRVKGKKKNLRLTEHTSLKRKQKGLTIEKEKEDLPVVFSCQCLVLQRQSEPVQPVQGGVQKKHTKHLLVALPSYPGSGSEHFLPPAGDNWVLHAKQVSTHFN